ncbi:MAG: DUF2330 domain-containing protein [Sandaracinaceae bacterium]
MRKTTSGPARSVLTAVIALIALTSAGTANAFCGFYVGGAGQELYNKATLVVMMRDGTRTVLSMRNAYEGPPENFAMVVPVPVVLQQEDVHTLPSELFDKVDTLAAPRLVEYWETDPCNPEPPYQMMRMAAMADSASTESEGSGGGDLGVRVEAQFAVGEYDIVILSARDSGGLETWLRREGYHIPDNAAPVLRPYVEQGTKFFVARVDVSRIQHWDGPRAMLSPLRVQYESQQFMLPVRLGLVNSAGEQDLIVHILGRNQRYEVANYDNVTIPTNLRVTNGVRNEFAPFYASLFDRVLAEHPSSVVTEYSWDAQSCDPCPGPTLDQEDLMTLGLDVIGGDPYSWTLTRLHYRYGADALGDDLVFRPAPPIVGGRGIPDQAGNMPREVTQNEGVNNFQGRYVILHPWEGEVACESPQRGVWGGPPGGGDPPAAPATNLAFATRGNDLGSYLAEDVPELSVHASAGSDVRSDPVGGGGRVPSSSAGCASCSDGAGTLPISGAIATAQLLGAFVLRRRG